MTANRAVFLIFFIFFSLNIENQKTSINDDEDNSKFFLKEIFKKIISGVSGTRLFKDFNILYECSLRVWKSYLRHRLLCRVFCPRTASSICLIV